EGPPLQGEAEPPFDVGPFIPPGRFVGISMAPRFEEASIKEIEELRREKDWFFKEGEDSPIPHQSRHSFAGLAYFPVDPKYRVRARLVRDPNPQRVVLA